MVCGGHFFLKGGRVAAVASTLACRRGGHGFDLASMRNLITLTWTPRWIQPKIIDVFLLRVTPVYTHLIVLSIYEGLAY